MKKASGNSGNSNNLLFAEKSMRPIVSGIEAPSYNSAKWLTIKLEELTAPDFSVKNLQTLSREEKYNFVTRLYS